MRRGTSATSHNRHEHYSPEPPTRHRRATHDPQGANARGPAPEQAPLPAPSPSSNSSSSSRSLRSWLRCFCPRSLVRAIRRSPPNPSPICADSPLRTSRTRPIGRAVNTPRPPTTSVSRTAIVRSTSRRSPVRRSNSSVGTPSVSGVTSLARAASARSTTGRRLVTTGSSICRCSLEPRQTPAAATASEVSGFQASRVSAST